MQTQMIRIYNTIKISTTICKWEIFSNEKDSYLQYFKYLEFVPIPYRTYKYSK